MTAIINTLSGKLLVICGPTATGKTSLGIILAKKYNGEIVSADSRQVYKGMDIITGKDLPKKLKLVNENSKLNIHSNKFDVGFRVKNDVPIWLVDIVKPDYLFNVGEYVQLAQKVIHDIWLRDKLPIIVGGTGFYVNSLLEPIETITIPPDNNLRQQLQDVELKKLQEELISLDKERWSKLNNSDRQNPRRLTRAIEVAVWRSKTFKKQVSNSYLSFISLLVIGLKAPYQKLYQLIDKRVEKRINDGAVDELRQLLSKNYSWNLPSFSSTGCFQLKNFIEGRNNSQQMVGKWKYQEHAYARRQMTWFKRDKRIVWFDITKDGYLHRIDEKVKKWYTAG